MVEALDTTKPCEWCGEPHPVEAICTPRLKVSRRRFLFLGASAAIAALAGVPTSATPLFTPKFYTVPVSITLDEVNRVVVKARQSEIERLLGAPAPFTYFNAKDHVFWLAKAGVAEVEVVSAPPRLQM